MKKAHDDNSVKPSFSSDARMKVNKQSLSNFSKCSLNSGFVPVRSYQNFDNLALQSLKTTALTGSVISPSTQPLMSNLAASNSGGKLINTKVIKHNYLPVDHLRRKDSVDSDNENEIIEFDDNKENIYNHLFNGNSYKASISNFAF